MRRENCENHNVAGWLLAAYNPLSYFIKMINYNMCLITRISEPSCLGVKARGILVSSR